MILVVENNPVQGEALSMQLTGRGHSCDWAANGEAALVRLGLHAYDALIVDQYMAGITGVELVRTMRQKEAWRGVPVLLLTAACGADLDEARRDLAGLAPAALLSKPCTVGQIEEALAALTGAAAAGTGGG